MPVDVSKMQCGHCLGPITTQEYASYGERCEDCFCNRSPATTGSLPAAIRNGCAQGTLRNNQRAKTCRNTKKDRSGG